MVLEVFEFNERAVKVYEKAGFRVSGRRIQTYRNQKIDTVDMEKTF